MKRNSQERKEQKICHLGRDGYLVHWKLWFLNQWPPNSSGSMTDSLWFTHLKSNPNSPGKSGNWPQDLNGRWITKSVLGSPWLYVCLDQSLDRKLDDVDQDQLARLRAFQAWSSAAVSLFPFRIVHCSLKAYANYNNLEADMCKCGWVMSWTHGSMFHDCL